MTRDELFELFKKCFFEYIDHDPDKSDSEFSFRNKGLRELFDIWMGRILHENVGIYPIAEDFLAIMDFRDPEDAYYHRADCETELTVFSHRYWSRKDGCFRLGPFGDRKKIMRTLCKKAGVKYFRFHALRHSGASQLDSCNVPIGMIQRILGHENRKTTEIYLHSVGESERAAVAILEGAA